MSDDYIKISVKLTPEVNAKLEELAAKYTNENKSEFFRKMITLMDIVEREGKENGAVLGLFKDGKLDARIIL